jgi:hypothetical protein
MRKILLATALCGALGLISCTNEKMAVNTVEEMKTTEMKNFDGALKTIMKPENRATPTEREQLGGKLNEKSLAILYSASKGLLTAHGTRVVDANTREEKEMAISMATKLYFEKIGNIKRNLNSEN